jgi:hypothetical protein
MFVSLRASPPSAGMIQIRESSARSLTKAICLPSGD